MGMVVRTNAMAINANRQLNNNNSNVSKSLQKLSSGFKINSAADDASGLAISEKMKAQITGLDQAAANSQDGISLVQTAEGATTQIHSMLNRMVELATKSANGTIQDDVDRDAIQAEVDQLNTEITRITESTNFNGINLLDGSLSGTGSSSSAGKLQGGIIANFKNATSGNITATDQSAFAAWTQKSVMNVDGTDITIDWGQLNSEETALLKRDFTKNMDESTVNKAREVLESKINEAIDNANKNNGTNVKHISVKGSVSGAGAAAGATFEFKSGMEGNKASSITFKGDATGTADAGSFNDYLSKLVGGITARTQYVAQDKFNGDIADVNGVKFDMMLDGESIDITVNGFSDTANDGAANATALKNAMDTALGNYATSKGLTAEQTTNLKNSFVVEFSDDGRLSISNTSGKSLSFADKDGNSAASTMGLTTDSKVKTGGLTLQIGDTADDFNKVTVSIDDLSAKGIGTEGLNVGTQASASTSIDTIKTAINKVSTNRANLGALQNRLEYTIDNLHTTSENMTSANSAIRDTDMATEMMQYTQNNVLTQAAQAMLAQANQNPQSVLQLLQ